MAAPDQPTRNQRRYLGRGPGGRRTSGRPLLLNHEALLTLARKVHAAAVDDDPQHLERAALHLLDTLASHVGYEAVAITRLSPAQARILRRGQRRLLSVATELAGEAAGGCTHPPTWCQSRTEELLALLMLQARDERAALHDSAA